MKGSSIWLFVRAGGSGSHAARRRFLVERTFEGQGVVVNTDVDHECSPSNACAYRSVAPSDAATEMSCSRATLTSLSFKVRSVEFSRTLYARLRLFAGSATSR